MESNFGILLKTVLDSSGIGGADIKEVQKVVDKYKVNINTDLDKAKLIKSVKDIVPKLEAELQKETGIKIKVSDSAIKNTVNQVFKDNQRLQMELDKILHDISSKTDRRYIKWKDIETGCFSDTRIDHSTILKCFERKNMDAFSYIKSQGFMMNPSSFSFHYTFDDGERVLSSMEYDFSVFLKEECNYQYKKDYNRDIKYKDFLSFKENSNHNCDYEFIVDNDRFYIEIAGIITNKNNDWETKHYSSIQEQNYQKKMIFKKKLLEENNIKYLFLFPEDFLNNDYKTKFINFVNFKGENVA